MFDLYAFYHSFYLIVFKKCWNISKMRESHSRSSITTHDLTFATVSRIEVLFVYDRLDLSCRFSNEDTINRKTSWKKMTSQDLTDRICKECDNTIQLIYSRK